MRLYEYILEVSGHMSFGPNWQFEKKLKDTTWLGVKKLAIQYTRTLRNVSSTYAFVRKKCFFNFNFIEYLEQN